MYATSLSNILNVNNFTKQLLNKKNLITKQATMYKPSFPIHLEYPSDPKTECTST